MKERGILFSDEMVRALLAGTKTQTRRMVKAAPEGVMGCHWSAGGWAHKAAIGGCSCSAIRCPYGEPGDRLWVRECFAFTGCGPDDRGAMDWGVHDIHGGDWEGERGCERWHVAFRASGDESPAAGSHPGWRPSIFMPRWASRITLEVTDVRAQRLHDIAEADALAEGVVRDHSDRWWLGARHRVAEKGWTVHETPRHAYESIWNAINGDGAWATNPWVWALTFARVDAAKAVRNV